VILLHHGILVMLESERLERAPLERRAADAGVDLLDVQCGRARGGSARSRTPLALTVLPWGASSHGWLLPAVVDRLHLDAASWPRAAAGQCCSASMWRDHVVGVVDPRLFVRMSAHAGALEHGAPRSSRNHPSPLRAGFNNTRRHRGPR